MIVTPHPSHVTPQNANDVIDVAHLVDQVVTSRGEQQTLNDSIHAPNRPSVISLAPNDLRHRLNKLRHKPPLDRPGFLIIASSSIPGYNRLDKLSYIMDRFQSLPGYQDLNWQYHDHSAAIIVEFSNYNYSSQAHQTIVAQFPELIVSIIDDLRQILSNTQSSCSHTPRYSKHHQDTTLSDNFTAQHRTHIVDTCASYRLRYIHPSLSHVNIQSNFSYYGHIESIQEVENLPPTQREVIITFDSEARLSLLDQIWAVNIKGHNISIAKASLTDSQLDYRKKYVVSFKGFHYRTTESQALRLIRPYGGMYCHFHQNIAYVAFKSSDQMHAVCGLRLYTDDGRLLSGRPRFHS